MRTFVVGDIHGWADKLAALLPQLRADASPGDSLVFIGDYVDRGPDSRGVVERYTIEWLIRRIHYLGGSVTIAVTLADAHRVWSAVMRQRSLARRAAPSPDTRPR